MSSNASVSILMACYNAAPFISTALESVIAQTAAPVEVIVVDDGSTDGSNEVVASLGAGRVRLIRQTKSGATVARNCAFAASKGQFVLYLDADDVIGPRHVESLLSALDGYPRCIALSPWDRFRGSLQEAQFPDRPTQRDMGPVDWILTDWSKAQPMTQSGMILIPRELIEQHGGWSEDLSVADDFEFFARIISLSAGVRFAPDARLYYRSGQAGTLSGRRGRQAAESTFQSLMRGTNHLLAVEDTQRTRHCCANLLKAFDYDNYPRYPDLRARMRSRVTELGGSDLAPAGPPAFQKLRPLIGWKLARRTQHIAEQYSFNRVARCRIRHGDRE